jgi:hypothetical protein
VTTQDTDELPPSPAPASVHDRVTAKLPEGAMSEAAAASSARCPRCGGHAEPRRRAPSRLNPFLRQAPPPGQVTCDDCGLDFELASDPGKALWATRGTTGTKAAKET